MPFIPHTDKDTSEMLATIGVDSIEDLFDEIPADLKIDELTEVPDGVSEMEIARIMHERANQDGQSLNFIGAGAYEHHIPAAVWEITTRGEFYSAYTPYQAEASQGTLQLLYEFQTMMASLMAMDVSNASLYDGASGLAEAILMAVRANRKSKSKKILVPGTLNPVYRKVARTLTKHQGIELIEVPFEQETGLTDQSALSAYEDEDITAVVINQPNFFGRLESSDFLTDWAHARNALVIAVVNPLAMSLIKPPGQWGEIGADIACGEGQPLGAPLSSGGPYYGFMTCRQSIVRQMPGRIIGKTVDADGKPGYTLTLQAREQHIRRSKATSNICTNQGLVVTASTIHMSILGAKGLQQVAAKSHANTNQLISKVESIPGVHVLFNGPGFHEVVLQLDCEVSAILRTMSAHGIQAGYDLSLDYPELSNCLLVCATETKTDADIQRYAELLERVVGLQSKAPCPVKPKFA
jgi:glycine dehydrogenase subunit 1